MPFVSHFVTRILAILVTACTPIPTGRIYARRAVAGGTDLSSGVIPFTTRGFGSTLVSTATTTCWHAPLRGLFRAAGYHPPTYTPHPANHYPYGTHHTPTTTAFTHPRPGVEHWAVCGACPPTPAPPPPTATAAHRLPSRGMFPAFTCTFPLQLPHGGPGHQGATPHPRRAAPPPPPPATLPPDAGSVPTLPVWRHPPRAAHCQGIPATHRITPPARPTPTLDVCLAPILFAPAPCQFHGRRNLLFLFPLLLHFTHLYRPPLPDPLLDWFSFHAPHLYTLPLHDPQPHTPRPLRHSWLAHSALLPDYPRCACNAYPSPHPTFPHYPAPYCLPARHAPAPTHAAYLPTRVGFPLHMAACNTWVCACGTIAAIPTMIMCSTIRLTCLFCWTSSWCHTHEHDICLTPPPLPMNRTYLLLPVT